MRTSRRSFVKLALYATASFATLVDGLPGSVAVAAAQTGATIDDDGFWLRRDMFEPLVGEYFTVQARSPVSVRLIAVEDVPSARQTGAVGSEKCFTLVFRGSRSSSTLAQGTYRVENGVLGTFLLFLVPGPATATGITYTATFNRV